jgi:hypothetical protein
MISSRGHVLTAAHNVLDEATGFTSVKGGGLIKDCTVLVAVFVADREPARWAYIAKIVSTDDALTKKLLPCDYLELSSPSLLDLAVLQITSAVETKPPSFSGEGRVAIIEEHRKFEDVKYMKVDIM